MTIAMRCALAALLFVSISARADDHADHPLLTRYEGSETISKQVEAHAQYALATRADPEAGPQGESVSGTVTRLVYRNPPGRSTQEIAANYEQALTGAGVQRVFSCALDECGPSYAKSAWNRYNGLFAAADGDPRYFAGRLDRAEGTLYVAVMVGRRRTQVDVIELGAMEQNKVVVDATALGDALARDGHVAVPGIYFDTDRATITSESAPALDEIAKLLAARPSLRVYVVGHTDMVGTLAHNLALSQARARAVVEALAGTRGVDRSRLEGHGVGPLAPAAGNGDESGRSRNRRVELVAR
jgi:OOP family OmpA-OmpF porin